MIWIYILGITLVVIFLGSAYVYYSAVKEAKAAVNAAPRIPMHVCPKHGPYPAKHTITINVPQENKPDLVQEMCVFCYDEKMKTAEQIFKT